MLCYVMLCISRKTQKQVFLLVSGGHICAPESFSEYLAYEILHRPDSWQGVLYIYIYTLYFLCFISQILDFLY